LSALAVIFLAFDSTIKLLKLRPVLDATMQLGFPASSIVPIAVVLLACTVLYVIPRTRLMGAVLLTGYLGGAVAAHTRVGNPVFETIFPIIVAAVVWAGLVIRDIRVRAVVFGSSAGTSEDRLRTQR